MTQQLENTPLDLDDSPVPGGSATEGLHVCLHRYMPISWLELQRLEF